MKNYLSFWFYQTIRKKYDETDRLRLLAHLENLQSDVIGKKVGHFVIHEEQSKLLGQSRIYSDLSYYNHPQINTQLFVEFGLPVNGKERILLQFSMGENLCIVGSYNAPLTTEEKVVYREILPFNYCSTNWRLAFTFFSERINFIVDFVAKKDKVIAIDLLEDKIVSLLRKEQSEYVINEVETTQNKLKELKEKFNKEYGYLYSL